MKIKEIAEILHGEILCAKEFENSNVFSACGSDMMSDVLAFVKDQGVLVTGLNNPQVVRTAEMMDMKCVVLVRGKRPDDVMLQIAKEHNIVLISTKERMFDACGKLYAAGLKTVE